MFNIPLTDSTENVYITNVRTGIKTIVINLKHEYKVNICHWQIGSHFATNTAMNHMCSVYEIPNIFFSEKETIYLLWAKNTFFCNVKVFDSLFLFLHFPFFLFFCQFCGANLNILSFFNFLVILDLKVKKKPRTKPVSEDHLSRN